MSPTKKPSRFLTFTVKWWKDVGERMVATFAQAWLATFVLTDLPTAKTAAIAGAGAVLAMLKGYAARHAGDPESASLVT